jgi:hypothetical protein
MRKRIIALVILAAGLSLAISGCTSGITLSPSEFTIPQCPKVSSPLSVGHLGDHKRTKCSPSGVKILFPDGQLISAPKVAATAGFTVGSNAETKTYYVANLGIYGLVAAEKINDHDYQWWGAPEAVRKARTACRPDQC